VSAACVGQPLAAEIRTSQSRARPVGNWSRPDGRRPGSGGRFLRPGGVSPDRYGGASLPGRTGRIQPGSSRRAVRDRCSSASPPFLRRPPRCDPDRVGRPGPSIAGPLLHGRQVRRPRRSVEDPPTGRSRLRELPPTRSIGFPKAWIPPSHTRTVGGLGRRPPLEGPTRWFFVGGRASSARKEHRSARLNNPVFLPFALVHSGPRLLSERARRRDSPRPLLAGCGGAELGDAGVARRAAQPMPWSWAIRQGSSAPTASSEAAAERLLMEFLAPTGIIPVSAGSSSERCAGRVLYTQNSQIFHAPEAPCVTVLPSRSASPSERFSS
jgi:hypothetical protein